MLVNSGYHLDVADIEVISADGNTALVGENDKLYKTIDGGVNWESIGTSNGPGGLAIDPVDSSIIYTGNGSNSIRYSTNGRTTWNESTFNTFGNTGPIVDLLLKELKNRGVL